MKNDALVQPAPLAALAAELRSGEESLPGMLARLFKERFETIEPQIQSFVPEANLFERLLQEAEALESRYPDPESRPLLYGVPVGVKDIFHVDGFVTRAGTKLPPELFAGTEAGVVNKLRDAGALIAGKTVTTEFAYYEPGPTRNPHHLAHTPGGSSSGSAAAVAAGLVPLANGTQTVGSVIRPAAFCGIVGYKPSFDRIDTTGLVIFSQSADHVGLFTQDVAGMWLAASVLVNDWRNDITADDRPVLAVPDGPYLQQAEALAAFEAQVERLEAAGFSVRRIATLDDIEAIGDLHDDMIAAELAHGHAEWFAEFEHLYRPRTAGMIRRGQSVDADRLQSARAHRLQLRERLQAQLRQAGADVWISPAAPGTAPEGIQSTGNPALNMPWTHAGLPAVTVPAGRDDDNLPLGLQISGAFNDDEHLLLRAGTIAAALGHI